MTTTTNDYDLDIRLGAADWRLGAEAATEPTTTYQTTGERVCCTDYCCD
ncbi:hypothetical protein ACFTSF_30135 [Kribbella sp. NPDC056951]